MLFLNPYAMGEWDYNDYVEFNDNPYFPSSPFWHVWREGWINGFNRERMEGRYEE